MLRISQKENRSLVVKKNTCDDPCEKKAVFCSSVKFTKAKNKKKSDMLLKLTKNYNQRLLFIELCLSTLTWHLLTAQVNAYSSVATHPHGLSCYACSTMDNEACRSLKPKSNLASTIGLTAHMNMLSSSQTTVPSVMGTTNKQVHDMSRSQDEESSTISDENNHFRHHHQRHQHLHHHHQQQQLQHEQDQINNVEGGRQLSTNDMIISSSVYPYNNRSLASIDSEETAQMGQFNRSHIKSRTCNDDEYFCSVVSIVRLEFVNNNFVSKFWALERNCSKSCNHGCIVIGERIKLRMCNECCNTQNCNVGDHSSTLLPSFALIYTMLCILISSTIITSST